MSQTPYTVCRKCSQPLNRHRSALGVERWFHGVEPADGHEPEPMVREPGQAVSAVCDVCSSRDPRWLYQVRLATWNIGANRPGPTVAAKDEEPAWLVCDECADLVDKRDADGLAERAVANLLRSLPASLPRAQRVQARLMMREDLLEMQRTFLSRVIGERVLWDPDNLPDWLQGRAKRAGGQ